MRHGLEREEVGGSASDPREASLSWSAQLTAPTPSLAGPTLTQPSQRAPKKGGLWCDAVSPARLTADADPIRFQGRFDFFDRLLDPRPNKIEHKTKPTKPLLRFWFSWTNGCPTRTHERNFLVFRFLEKLPLSGFFPSFDTRTVQV